MKAPRKLYLQPSTIKQLPHQNIVYIIPLADNSIEYIRTDVFIEKAEEYLENKFINDVSVLTGGVVSINFSIAIKNFLNYMKGE